MSSQPNEYQTAAHANAYLNNADDIPHRREGALVILELLPDKLGHVMDLGAGDGLLLDFIKAHKEIKQGVATDFSQTMLEHARNRFAEDASVTVLAHDLNDPLPPGPPCDAIVSSFAIHHVTDERKYTLYQEIYDRLAPGGYFCNLEHVSSPTQKLHEDFYKALGTTADQADPSNICAPVEVQLNWLREIGFADVDCYWKWRELALLAGQK
ncbi:MAG: trans-aconitate 2-methyltransferase [Rhodothermales bacterium]